VGAMDTVLRDELYNGNAKMEKCAVVIREAENFIRFGSFEGSQISHRKLLLDYLLKNHFKFEETLEKEDNKQNGNSL
jgi:uncharacterized protein YdiU (UPF0061 family)